MLQMREMEESMTWLLMDVSFLAYRALYSVGHLELEDIPTGVIFGFLSQFRAVCERLRSTKAVLFFDSDSRESLRARVYPAYKGQRKRDQEEEHAQQVSILWKQMRMLEEELLPDIGLQCLRQNGLESDDLIALAAKGGEKSIIVSADGDLYQCITDTCHWYDPARKVMHSPGSFIEKYGIDPCRWGEVKTIAGCKSDNVNGVHGVGEATAIKYLNGVLPPRYQKYQNIENERGQEIIERNQGLVILPHEKTEPFELVAPNYDPKIFFKYCRRFGLQSFLKKRAGWRDFFNGPKTRKRRKR